MNLNKGDFIKWSFTDGQGRYHWIGQVVSHKDGMIEFENSVGSVFGIPEGDGTIEKIAKPSSWDRERASLGKALIARTREEKKAAVKSIKKPKTNRSGQPTKIDQVIALLNENPDLINNRKQAIDEIVRVVGMTPAGASTYFSNAKKKVVLGG